eukprot:3884305-Amphidinium_carterae.8
MFTLEMYGVNTAGARASAQDMGAWVLDTLWAEVRARCQNQQSRFGSDEEEIVDAKISPVPNAHYAQLRPEMAMHIRDR